MGIAIGPGFIHQNLVLHALYVPVLNGRLVGFQGIALGVVAGAMVVRLTVPTGGVLPSGEIVEVPVGANLLVPYEGEAIEVCEICFSPSTERDRSNVFTKSLEPAAFMSLRLSGVPTMGGRLFMPVNLHFFAEALKTAPVAVRR